MLRVIRKANLILLAVVLWQGYLLLVHTGTANAQPALFLARPYYGAFSGWSDNFDHSYPNYVSNNLFTRYTGQSSTVPNCPTLCYEGHDGYDFLIAYQPVVASAPGSINFSGWAYTNHALDFGLNIKIDHGNNYRTIYGHLSAVRYQTGNNVQRWQIGTSGTTGNSTGPHLHFGVLYNQSGVWKVTDPYGWTDLVNPDPWEQLSQIHSDPLWLNEPARTQSPPPDGGSTTTQDDNGTNFSTTCLGANHWHVETTTESWNSNFHWMPPSGNSTVDCWANWNKPALPDTGQYEVQIFVPTWSGYNGIRTQSARYRVDYSGGSTIVVVDQSRVGYTGLDSSNNPTYAFNGGQWISLGRYNFSQASSFTEFVQVADTAYINAYYDFNTNRMLVDAVRWKKTH